VCVCVCVCVYIYIINIIEAKTSRLLGLPSGVCCVPALCSLHYRNFVQLPIQNCETTLP